MKPATFEDAVMLYENMIKGQLKKLCIYKNHEEYYQCGLIGLWRAYANYDEEKGSFPSYAYINVRGYLIEQLKKEKRFETRHTMMEQESMEYVSGKVEDKKVFFEYTSMLNETERFIVTSYFYHRNKMDEIAEELRITYHQARWIYRKAMEKMRKK
ncbi:sigma-70 family RNA polymerase sigma factor [Bacillus manliponensis]|uniref:sigma-70 family RNA polymerase sigma factor n=1 Tax=Bacillus manliponensis TaxID=574376 RepID=UPI003512F0DC